MYKLNNYKYILNYVQLLDQYTPIINRLHNHEISSKTSYMRERITLEATVDQQILMEYSCAFYVDELQRHTYFTAKNRFKFKQSIKKKVFQLFQCTN